jgi:L-ascorbate metabolism protein UlaG (beta-lactamase superfamily)
MAIQRGHSDVTKALLEGGAETEISDPNFQRTPAHWAAIKGNQAILEHLLSAGANLNARDLGNRIPFEYAAKHGHKAVAELLADHGGEIADVEENYGPSPLLTADYAGKEAAMWYLGHCGWGIKTKNHFLIFDYWEQGGKPDEPSLANGHIDPSEIDSQNVSVFVTHEHQDHFDLAISAWEESVADIQYFFGFKPEELPQFAESGYAGPAYQYVGPHMTIENGGIEIMTIEANDAGVGFLVQVDGLNIYHAGDHAGWIEGEREGYTKEIDYLAEHVDKVDFAFLNITGCHCRDEVALKESIEYALQKLHPTYFIPTHALDREYLYREFAEGAEEEGWATQVIYPENRGDHFQLKNGKVI